MATVKRRQYGSGSIHQRSDGLWIGTLEAGVDARGRRRRLTVSAKSESRAKEKLEELKRSIARSGLPVAGSGRSTTVEAWSKTYLSMALAELRPKSYTSTASAIRRWIIPTIGRKRLAALTPADVRAITEAQRAAGRGGATQGRTYDVLRTMLKAAILEGHDVPQRVLMVKRPRLGENDRQAISTPDALAILRVSAELPEASLWASLFLQGLRQGERLGLTWEHVDLVRGTLDVSWQLQRLVYADGSRSSFRVPDGYVARHLEGALHLVRPKTKASRRTIPLTPWLAEALAAWREVAPPSPHDLVWPDAEGRPRRPEIDRAEWVKIQELADVRHPSGRPYVLHEARHSTATILRELNVDVSTIELILGHSKFVETYDHADRLDDARQALAQVAGRLALEGRSD
jgi:integrase